MPRAMRDPLLARRGPAPGLAHPLAHVFGHLHARDLVVEELGVPVAREREEPDEHGEPERLDVVEEPQQHVGVVYRLGHHELGARRLLLAQPRDLARVVERSGLGAGREQEAGGPAERLSGRVDAVVQARRELEDADRVQIVDGSRVRKVAHLRRVARDDDQVPEAEIVGARGGARASRGGSGRGRRRGGSSPSSPRAPADRHREVAHTRLGASAVGDVDDVHAAGLEASSPRRWPARGRARPAGSPRPRRRTACRASPPAGSCRLARRRVIACGLTTPSRVHAASPPVTDGGSAAIA